MAFSHGPVGYCRVPSGIPQVYEAHDGVCDEWTADIEFRDFEQARFKPKPLDDEVRTGTRSAVDL